MLFFSSSEHFWSWMHSFWITVFFSLIVVVYFSSIVLMRVLIVSNSCLYLSNSLFTSDMSFIHNYKSVGHLIVTCSLVLESIARVLSWHSLFFSLFSTPHCFCLDFAENSFIEATIWSTDVSFNFLIDIFTYNRFTLQCCQSLRLLIEPALQVPLLTAHFLLVVSRAFSCN